MHRQPVYCHLLLGLLSCLVLLLAGSWGAPAYARPAPVGARVPAVDLWITTAENRAAAVPGDDLLLTVRCGNQGAAPAVGTTVTVTLPSGVGLIEAYPAAVQSANTLTWDTGSFGPHSEPFTILVKAQVTAAATINQTVLIGAGIAGPEPDADPGNNLVQLPLYIGYRFNFPFFSVRFVAF